MDATTQAPERISDALAAADMYYNRELTMDAIGRELHTSRSTVSRLLRQARDSGLVTIRVQSPGQEPSRLRDVLAERFGVSAYLAPMPERISEVDRLERVAASAARILDRFFDSNMTIGLAWGATVSTIGRRLLPTPLSGTQFVQLNGAGNTHTTGVGYASEILRRFGEAYSSTVQEFPVPALFDAPATREALWRERSIARIVALQERMSAVLFGLGAPSATVPSHIYSGGYLDAADHASLRADGVVGDVATMFFRADGTWDGIALNSRSSGPDLALVRRTPRRVCVVSGPSKLASLRGALAAGLVTDLIVDEPTARALVDTDRD